MSKSFKTNVISQATHAEHAGEEQGTKTTPIVEVYATIAYPEIGPEGSPAAGGKRQAMFLVQDQDSIDALHDLVASTSFEAFRNRTLPAGAFNPLRSADEKSVSGEYAFRHRAFRVPGAIVFRAKTAFPVPCVSGPDKQEIDPTSIQGGDQVVAEISAYAYSNKSTGIGLSLNRIWLIHRGTERIERGSGVNSSVRRINPDRLRFSDEAKSAAA